MNLLVKTLSSLALCLVLVGCGDDAVEPAQQNSSQPGADDSAPSQVDESAPSQTDG